MNSFKIIKKLLIGIVVAVALVLFSWASVPLLWYPKFDEIDTAKLIEEADKLFASCDVDTTLASITVDLSEITTPYIISLDSHDVSTNQLLIDCDAGMRLTLWDDRWTSTAGLYVMRQGSELPSDIAPFAAQLDGRIHQWHNAG